MRRILVVVALAAIGLAPMPATGQTTPECFGKAATIVGTEGDDRLFGTTGGDVIAALGGRFDTVRGWPEESGTVPTLPDEADYICGSRGEDWLFSGYGRDHMSGGSNHDELSGGNGNDVLEGGAQYDYIRGEGGHDRLFGGGNGQVGCCPGTFDVLSGGNGDDYLDGGVGGDRMGGGSGFDTCVVDEEDPAPGQCEKIIQAT